MKPFQLARAGEPLSVLCLGAHSDDIEIGAGATLLSWMAAGALLNVHWCVLSAQAARADEAAVSAEAFLARAAEKKIELCEFRDGYFPYDGASLKDWFEGLKERVNPDVVLTHWQGDAHQDHREVSSLTWNSFRDHLILEYEIPKWDGDVGQPNFYVPLPEDILDRKVELLDAHFGSQRSKDWFSAETFRGLARLRGMEARASSGYAEAFFVRKLVATV
jgi:LmbE family N-acetylglucosaminyl deacetylase